MMNNFWLRLRGSARKFAQINIADESYSWWVKPISIYKDGFNFFSSIDLNGDRIIRKLDLEGGFVDASAFNADIDEHSTAAILPLETTNELLVAFCGHNDEPIRRFKINRDTMVVSEAVSVVGTGNYSYVQLVEASGRIFLFSRVSGFSWNVFISTDNGVNFGTPTLFVTREVSIGDKLYISTQKTGDNLIKIGLYNHPFSGDDNELHYFELNTDTGDVSSLGNMITNLYSGFSTIQASALTPIYDLNNTIYDRFRFLDNVTTKNGITYFLIAEFLGSESADYRSGDYRMVAVNNSNYMVTIFNIVPHGKDGNFSYFGGVYFVQNDLGEWNNQIYLSREENEVWYCEKYEFNGSGFIFLETVDTIASGSTDNSGVGIYRPQPPYNSDKFGAKVSYQKGDYFEGFVNWDNEIIIK